MAKKNTRSTLTEQEKQDFDKLYQFIKTEIFGYDDMKLPQYMVLRLIGMSRGQFIANNNQKIEGSYSFKEILLTFQIHKLTLINSSKHIKEEKGRFNYIMAIVESKINDIKRKLKEKEKTEAKVSKIDIDIDTQLSGSKYQKKDSSENKIAEKHKDLW